LLGEFTRGQRLTVFSPAVSHPAIISFSVRIVYLRGKLRAAVSANEGGMPDLNIPNDLSGQGDPVVALVAERSLLVAEWDAALDAADATVADRSSDRFYSHIGRLEDQIAGVVATSAAGVIGQVRVLREICEGAFNTDRATDCADELFSSIAAGVERLAGSGSRAG